MSAPFAALEARVNASVIACLSNATADLGGSVMVDGEFKQPYADSFGLVANDKPSFRGLTQSLASLLVDSPFSIRYGNGAPCPYTIVAIRPDGSGMTSLDLK